MARMNIDIDEELLATVMSRYGTGSKKAAVDLALRRLVSEPMSTDEVLAMAGIGFDLGNDDIGSLSAGSRRVAGQPGEP